MWLMYINIINGTYVGTSNKDDVKEVQFGMYAVKICFGIHSLHEFSPEAPAQIHMQLRNK